MSRTCLNCRYHKSIFTEVSKPITHRCENNNQKTCDAWWSDPKREDILTCFTETEGAKMLDEMLGLLDKMDKVLDKR